MSHRIRSQLPSHREELVTSIEGFGVYRPTSIETSRKLGQLTCQIVPMFNDYIANRRTRFAEIRPQDNFGMTVVPYSMVSRKKGRNTIGSSDLCELIDALPDDVVLDPLRLTINGLEWLKTSPNPEDWRTLAIKFDQDENYELMSRQFERIDDALAQYNLAGAVEKPQKAHTSLLKYGRADDGMTLSKNLSSELLEIAERRRKALGIFTVEVEPVVIGDDYRVSDPLIARRLASRVRVI